MLVRQDALRLITCQGGGIKLVDQVLGVDLPDDGVVDLIPSVPMLRVNVQRMRDDVQRGPCRLQGMQ